MKEKLNRLWNFIYAIFTGHFWIACPRCGVRFGGHEIKGINPIAAFELENRQAKFYRIVCPHCKKREIPTERVSQYIII